jgi:hypothetical protein
MMVDTNISIDEIRDFFARVLTEDAAVLALIDDCAAQDWRTAGG